MIRCIQIIFHLPILKIVFPSNVMMVITELMPFVMFDFVENPMEYDLSLIYKVEEQEPHPVINGQIESIGYEGTNFIMNIQTINISIGLLSISFAWALLHKIWAVMSSDTELKIKA